MIDKFLKYCKSSFQFAYDESYSVYEMLIKVIEKLNEVIGVVNGFESDLSKKEDSINITNNRKLSETGDFTGAWFGDTKTNIDQQILNGQNLYQQLLDFYEANPQIWVNVYDAKFYMTMEETDKIADGGTFGEPYTQEIDCGLFIYPCVCLNN